MIDEVARLEYLDKLSKSESLQFIEWLKCKNDPYFFLTNWAFTEDAHYDKK